MYYTTDQSGSSPNKTLHPRNEAMGGPDRARWRISNNKEPFDLYQLIGDFCDWYDRALDSRGSRLTARVSSDLPRFFHDHILMLGFLIWNIASYSLEFLGSEDVTLEVHAEPFRENWYLIYFSLAVPGIGIPHEKEKVLFLPSDRSRKKETSNSPVSNLYYAGIIAELLGGKIHIRNRRGFGVEYIAEVCLLNDPSIQNEEF